MTTTWPDGTPKSMNNAFTAFGGATDDGWAQRLEKRRRASAAARKAREDRGDKGTIPGLSRRADALLAPKGRSVQIHPANQADIDKRAKLLGKGFPVPTAARPVR